MTSMTPRHDAQKCHTAGESRREMISQLKQMVAQLNCCEKKEQNVKSDYYPEDCIGTPLITYPQTKERPEYSIKFDRIPPWEKRKASVAVVAGNVVHGCQCLKRDGLQADCKLPGCGGLDLCLTKPYPICLPSGRANELVTPEQADYMLNQLPPIPEEDGFGNCRTNEPCTRTCLECNASLRDICRWNPGWLSDKH